MSYSFRGYTIPEYMEQSLRDYILKGTPVGHFLSAVLDGDLHEAVAQADQENVANLPAYCGYLYNECPRDCWGSRQKRLAWIEKGKRGSITVRLTCFTKETLPRDDEWDIT